VVGTLQDYPTEGLAQRALDTLRKDINVEHPRSALQATTMTALIEHYEDKEMGEYSTKTFATCVTYRGYFRKWIKPRWGKHWSEIVLKNPKRALSFTRELCRGCDQPS
jgi:hypothetical protein